MVKYNCRIYQNVPQNKEIQVLTQNADKKREQIQMFCIDDLVPQDHLLRLIDQSIDWSFIYDLVEEKYSPDQGRPSIDPVMLIKIPLIQYLYGIKSMRQTIKEIDVNVAYRWFLGLDMYDKVPHFSTFGKNYTRRFQDTDLFEQIFSQILSECYKYKLVDPNEIFIDSTHVKARANNKKWRKKLAEQETLFYQRQLQKEIQKDRAEHNKKLLKDKNNNDPDNPGSGTGHEIKESTTDPESGWFHKGEHKQVFAYSVETACDKNGWILGYDVSPGNLHDSRTFKGIYDKIKEQKPEMIVMDAGYKTPAIARLLLEDGIKPLFPYKRPMTKKGFFRKYEYVYDEAYDCYICPNYEILKYSTTNREGYREYKSNPSKCRSCPYLSQCTESRNHVKLVTRHVWEGYMEACEDIRYTIGMKEVYQLRKETIERIFGTAKEGHGFRYTQMYGKARMDMKVGLTFACMNLKKLAKMLLRKGKIGPGNPLFLAFHSLFPSEFCFT